MWIPFTPFRVHHLLSDIAIVQPSFVLSDIYVIHAFSCPSSGQTNTLKPCRVHALLTVVFALMCFVSTVSYYSVLSIPRCVLCLRSLATQCCAHFDVSCVHCFLSFSVVHTLVSCVHCFLSFSADHTLMCLVSSVSCHPVLSTLWCVLYPLFPVTQYCPHFDVSCVHCFLSPGIVHACCLLCPRVVAGDRHCLNTLFLTHCQTATKIVHTL